jgi:hypothetical protein
MTSPTALPVRVVASGGVPVTEASNGFGLPVTPVISGGLAVTIVTAPHQGMPVVGSGQAPI